VSIDTSSGTFDSDLVLLAAATDARTRAQAHYSNFQVGAALETVDGVVIGGCNIENATYGLTLCAERVALVKALSDGHSIFTRIAVVADTEAPTPPCGACRQIIWEFCGDIDVIIANLTEVKLTLRMKDLLPLPFDKSLL
jgi:cytidine deaminase